VAVLRELARRGEVDADVPAKAVELYHLRDEQVTPDAPELGEA
jgi:pyruvate dehydrogenase complex dehydrogenase (E1) component